MRRPSIAWIFLAVLYAVFLLWYDGGGGPLSPQEIERHAGIFQQRGGRAEQIAGLRAFLESDPGGDFVMANYLHFRDESLAAGELRAGESSRQALDRYMAHMYPALFRRACHPVFAGPVVAPALDVWGIDDAESWSFVGLVRYRSPRVLLALVGIALGALLHVVIGRRAA